MERELPYRAEYAKSSRASCRACKKKIEKETLRLAAMVQSPMFDGKTPNWYHDVCFFAKQRPKTTDDIQHFESLRWEDQEKIREKIATLGSAVLPKAGKGRKRASTAADASGAVGDFRIEYAKSARALCRGCEQKIIKDEVRIAKKDFETDVGKKYGGQDMWHHLTCFASLRSTLNFFADGAALPGYNSLKAEDKTAVKKHLPAIKQEEEPETKKLKEDVEGDKKEDVKLKAQNKLVFKYRDQLQTNLNKTELQDLMKANKQEIPVGVDTILDRLSDLMAFGRLLPCKTCGDGQLVFNKYGYECRGDLTEWAKCGKIEKEPKREAFTIPKELKEKHSFLKKFKSVVGSRYIKDVQPAASVKKDEKNGENDGPKVQREKPPLYQMSFVIDGCSKMTKPKITKLGGKVVSAVNNNVIAVISTKDRVEEKGRHILAAIQHNVHVVSTDFLEEAKNKTYEQIVELVPKFSICDWGSDVQQRLTSAEEVMKESHKSKSIYTKSVPKSVKMKLKGGTVVDPDSGLEDTAHVYENDDGKYTAVLGITDLQSDKNSYYKLQILQADKGRKIWLFRSWGRIGTTIGGTKLEPMSSILEAEQRFHDLYEEKSGNDWLMRDAFEKVPGKLYPIDVDFADDEVDNVKMSIIDASSLLPVPVQNLMKLIFNIEDMKKVMLEFELDTDKMPLGKLSKNQILKAYSVLNELQRFISASDIAETLFIDASNRFYTFIPHAVGVDALPVLKSQDQLKQKIEMLDNLMELEIAYNLMRSSKSGNIDERYAKLNTEIGVLDRKSDEFQFIEKYVKNTHAATHNLYKLRIDEVFTIKRQGEEKRFKPFKKLHNHKLLWHGSRLTNFAGILSQGLRIAPPEAPTTGYMFGKGVYFADMVTKSANYCLADRRNPKGLLLLSDVALGDMHELTASSYIEKLPKGKHSCKGVGKTCPNPKASKMWDGIEVPLGKSMNAKVNSQLLYNEFIVYDVAQVNAKYLLEVTFDYKK